MWEYISNLFEREDPESKIGKKDTVVYKQKSSEMMKDDWWVETSGKLASAILPKLNVVEDEDEVRKLLGDKEFEWHGEHPEGLFPGYNGWYTRDIGGKSVTKIIVRK